MKLYQGNALDPMRVRRQKRRDWFKEIVGVIVILAAFWIFTILMFLM